MTFQTGLFTALHGQCYWPLVSSQANLRNSIVSFKKQLQTKQKMCPIMIIIIAFQSWSSGPIMIITIDSANGPVLSVLLGPWVTVTVIQTLLRLPDASAMAAAGFRVLQGQLSHGGQPCPGHGVTISVLRERWRISNPARLAEPHFLYLDWRKSQF